MALKIIDHGSNDYKEMVKLRQAVLRTPLGLTLSPEELEAEKNDILIANIHDDEIIGCCILTRLDNEKLQLRQMAVNPKYQGRGIGDNLMNFMENLARDKGYKVIRMDARDSAQKFYEKFGYKIISPEFQKLGIPHHLMEKTLKVKKFIM